MKMQKYRNQGSGFGGQQKPDPRTPVPGPLILIFYFLSLNFLAAVMLVRAEPAVAWQGKPVNVVPFGALAKWDAEGKDYGVIWEDSRDIFWVVVKFADSSVTLSPQDVKLQYWQSTWPRQRIPRDTPSGAGSSGWLNVGDWFQGKWLTADTNLEINGNTYKFTFNPVNSKELPDMRDFSAKYRSTLKLRVVCDAPLPIIAAFEAYTDSIWDSLEFEVEWGGIAREQEQIWDGRLEIFNGIIEQIRLMSPDSKVKVGLNHSWLSTVQGRTDGIRARVFYADTKAYNSFDETIVTVRTGLETFSFAASDLIKHGYMFLPDFGVIIRRLGDRTTYESAQQHWRNNQQKNIYVRVSQVAEQTLPRAWGDMPAKEPFYIPLSFEGGRQYFGVEPDGSVFCNNNWLRRIQGRDTKRWLFEGDSVRYSFGLSDAKLVDRHLVDGSLPMIVAEWQRDGVRYRQTAFVVPLDGVPQQGKAIYADDTLVLMARFEMERSAETQAQAKLVIQVDSGGTERLGVNNGIVVAEGTEPKRLRLLVASAGPADTYELQAEDKTIAYRANLTADAPKRIVDVAIPFVTLTEQTESFKLQNIRFDQAFEQVRQYWSKRVAEGAQIVTPESWINDFYRAHVSHLLLNTNREVGASNRYVARVGTFSYGAFSNESCMMVSDLDRRGYQKRAEEALETWLHYQGTVALPGNFSTSEGIFYGAGGYEAGGYNQHHGFVLWCLAEHYWYTRDTAWLKRVAPKIVKGCEWIIRERKRTIIEAEQSPIHAIERGLLPAGCLEDIKDWRFWLSTNVYSWWGMQNAAAALDDAGLPEGKPLLEEAAAYRKDILKAFTEAMRRSPVVQLRDGSWIPHIPPEVHRRGRTFGWITETLEGAIHMIRTGLIEPWDRMSTWIIKDFEDNLYISEQYGYNITGDQAEGLDRIKPDSVGFERYWFSRGGISMQANLLCNPIPYLLRDEPKHFLRAYFNAFAVSYWPDTRMMTEHALPNIGDHRGDHYKSSDEANSTYWLRMMFIQERGDELWLGAAVPRYWLAQGKSCGIENAATYFGPMSVVLRSMVEEGRIEMTIDPPRRNPPKRILARFRHPKGKTMTRCELNGKRVPARRGPAYDRFDPQKEWVILEAPALAGPIHIIAYYE